LTPPTIDDKTIDADSTPANDDKTSTGDTVLATPDISDDAEMPGTSSSSAGVLRATANRALKDMDMHKKGMKKLSGEGLLEKARSADAYRITLKKGGVKRKWDAFMESFKTELDALTRVVEGEGHTTRAHTEALFNGDVPPGQTRQGRRAQLEIVAPKMVHELRMMKLADKAEAKNAKVVTQAAKDEAKAAAKAEAKAKAKAKAKARASPKARAQPKPRTCRAAKQKAPADDAAIARAEQHERERYEAHTALVEGLRNQLRDVKEEEKEAIQKEIDDATELEAQFRRHNGGVQTQLKFVAS